MQLNIEHLSILVEKASAQKGRVSDLREKVAFLGNGSLAPKFRKLLKEAQTDLSLLQNAIDAIKKRHGLK